jgi:diguanylate cyclase (GGDEF)-like protein/PAS domain S-box-containing protein
MSNAREPNNSMAPLPIAWSALFSVLESLTEAFCTLDRKWCFTYLNAEAEQHFDQPRAELLGQCFWDECAPVRGTADEVQAKSAVEHGTPYTFDLYDVTRKKWKEIHIFPSAHGLAMSCLDITTRKLKQEAEQDHALRFQAVARATTDVIFDWNVATDHVWWSDGLPAVFGYDPTTFALTLQGWADHVHPEERERTLRDFCEGLQNGNEKWTGEYRFLRKDGSYADVCANAIIARDRDGKAIRVIGAMTDVTENKRIEARIRLQASLLDKARDAISVTGIDGHITYWNCGAERLFGWSEKEALGRLKADLTWASGVEGRKAFQSVLEDDEWVGELTKQRKDGSEVVVTSHLTLVRDDGGQPQAVLEIETDITQRKAAEQKILTLAFYDPLTRLPNRRMLLDRLGYALARCARTNRSGALLFLDLDNFKSLNDTLGHDKGDELLEQVARRLEAQVPRASDTVARHGGDEFVILLEDLGADEREAAIQAEQVAERILQALEVPFQLGPHVFHTTTSVGVAMFDKQIVQGDEVLKRGDLAMYQAKGAGRNTARFFDRDMQKIVDTRVQMESDMRSGLQRGEFYLMYQQQTDNAGRTVGAEALLRWKHPRGALSPAVFVPLAEETGLISRLGYWVLETACRQLVEWAHTPNKAGLTLAVNVSARQFRQTGFVDEVLELLDRTGANPHRLKLELTESLLVENVDHTIEHMYALKAKGVSFALDDFGTGYSSLAYLKRLPLDQLKIDQSFVRDVLTDPNDAAIVRTILALGQTLGLHVIAEGVETRSQRDFLAAHGCHSFQGYLFGPPVTEELF